jgi:hypothetical protein
VLHVTCSTGGVVTGWQGGGCPATTTNFFSQAERERLIRMLGRPQNLST